MKCDGWANNKQDARCLSEATHLDQKGFIYCERCGRWRKRSGYRVRKMRPHELRRIERGELIASY